MRQIVQIMKSSSILGLFLEVIPITLLVGLIYTVCRVVRIKRQGAQASWSTEIIRLLFVCYLTGLINLILVPNNFWTYFWFYVRNGYSGGELNLFSGGFNLIPTLYRCLIGELELGSWVKKMLLGNILMFVPMGVFLPLVNKRVTKQNILPIAIAIPVIVELIQPIIGRSFDVDDLIYNFVGIVIGYFMIFTIKRFAKYRCNTQENG